MYRLEWVKRSAVTRGWTEGSRTVSSNIVQTTRLRNRGCRRDPRYRERERERDPAGKWNECFARETRCSSVASISIDELDFAIETQTEKKHLHFKVNSTCREMYASRTVERSGRERRRRECITSARKTRNTRHVPGTLLARRTSMYDRFSTGAFRVPREKNEEKKETP